MADIQDAELRLLLWDRGDSAILTPEDIDVIKGMSGGVLSRAVAIGWAIIGGYYSQMIDIVESGSERRLSQLYKNAERMHKIWDDKAIVIETAMDVAVVRVPPVGFCVYDTPVDWENMVSIFRPNEPINVRYFPLYRMPAVK